MNNSKLLFSLLLHQLDIKTPILWEDMSRERLVLVQWMTFMERHKHLQLTLILLSDRLAHTHRQVTPPATVARKHLLHSIHYHQLLLMGHPLMVTIQHHLLYLSRHLHFQTHTPQIPTVMSDLLVSMLVFSANTVWADSLLIQTVRPLATSSRFQIIHSTMCLMATLNLNPT